MNSRVAFLYLPGDPTKYELAIPTEVINKLTDSTKSEIKTISLQCGLSSKCPTIHKSKEMLSKCTTLQYRKFHAGGLFRVRTVLCVSVRVSSTG